MILEFLKLTELMITNNNMEQKYFIEQNITLASGKRSLKLTR